MSNIEFQEMPGLDDERKVVANGRRYHAKTKNKCTTCSDAESVFYVKMKLSGSTQLVLECPKCDTSMTLLTQMVTIAK